MFWNATNIFIRIVKGRCARLNTACLRWRLGYRHPNHIFPRVYTTQSPHTILLVNSICSIVMTSNVFASLVIG